AADQVGRLRIVAPIAGIVQTIATQTSDTLRQLQPGDAVTSGQAIVTLSSNTGFVVRARVDEQDIANVRTGQPTIVSGEDLGTTTLPGHVLMIGAVAQKSDDPSNTARQIITTIALDKTVPYLRDGMSVDVDIITQDRRRALTVPADAIRRDDSNKPYVLVVAKGRTAKQIVRLGPVNDTQAVIAGGLEAGQTVVAERNIGIVDAMAVSPTTAPAPSPSPGK
ncbi:MAG TPA: HlyD family efflux transporter periplasmic adaptor subunit, partial [Vicinamibacterales bacterium]|nr:HlyD family efflux transporter periplasmic adaptor subunit [Vicinamibacterales bacterium]